jgi:hypothetical protein
LYIVDSKLNNIDIKGTIDNKLIYYKEVDVLESTINLFDYYRLVDAPNSSAQQQAKEKKTAGGARAELILSTTHTINTSQS